MSVGEDGVVDCFRIGGKRFLVAVAELRSALEDATVDEQALACGFDKIFGTRDRSGGAEKSEFGHRGVIFTEIGDSCQQMGIRKSEREKLAQKPSECGGRLLLLGFLFAGHYAVKPAGLAPGVFVFSCLSLTCHFLESASPREKTDDSGRFRFRARAQTAASRAIFATPFAFPVVAAHPIARWTAPWWNAPGLNARHGNCSASCSLCQRREQAHAAQRSRRCCLHSSCWMRLLVRRVSRILRVHSGWPGAVRWDLPSEDHRSRCQVPDNPPDSLKDRSMDKNSRGRARNTMGCSRSHTDTPIPNPNTATRSRSQIPSPIRIRVPNIRR